MKKIVFFQIKIQAILFIILVLVLSSCFSNKPKIIPDVIQEEDVPIEMVETPEIRSSFSFVEKIAEATLIEEQKLIIQNEKEQITFILDKVKVHPKTRQVGANFLFRQDIQDQYGVIIKNMTLFGEENKQAFLIENIHQERRSRNFLGIITEKGKEYKISFWFRFAPREFIGRDLQFSFLSDSKVYFMKYTYTNDDIAE